MQLICSSKLNINSAVVALIDIFIDSCWDRSDSGWSSKRIDDFWLLLIILFSYNFESWILVRKWVFLDQVLLFILRRWIRLSLILIKSLLLLSLPFYPSILSFLFLSNYIVVFVCSKHILERILIFLMKLDTNLRLLMRW